MKKTVVIITGMHRSGTSMFTSYLQKCGLYLGESLLPGNTGNERGHFEDTGVMHFHEEILQRTGHRYIIGEMTRPVFEIRESDPAVISGFVGRLAQKDVFGFKEPRTSLFLDLWDRSIPKEYDKKYVFLYRNPDLVVDSLLRRGTDPDVTANPLTGYKCWYIYNRELLRFYRKNKSHCIFVSIDKFIQQPQVCLDRINKKFGLQLAGPALESIFEKKEFKQNSETSRKYRKRPGNASVYFKCWLLYQKLRLLNLS